MDPPDPPALAVAGTTAVEVLAVLTDCAAAPVSPDGYGSSYASGEPVTGALVTGSPAGELLSGWVSSADNAPFPGGADAPF